MSGLGKNPDGKGILERKVEKTVFTLDVLLHTPGILSPREIADDIASQFLSLVVDEAALTFFAKNLTVAAAARLQTYWAWSQQRGGEIGDAGPDWRSQKRRGAILVGLGTQRSQI